RREQREQTVTRTRSLFSLFPPVQMLLPPVQTLQEIPMAWVRQCELDSTQDAPPPIPARIASNEEFIPPPQTPQQKEYEARVRDISERAAKRLGLDRRDFLRTGSGMAAALLALNQVFGDCYAVGADEVDDPKA